MLLFPSHPFAADPFGPALDDLLSLDDVLADSMMRPAAYVPRRSAQPCGRSCAAFAPPPPPAYRLVRQPAFAPPVEPEVHLKRGSDGVVAYVPLGRGFSRQDVSLELEGRDLELTVFHPGTQRWAERPAAYRRTLELAPHIDARGISARLADGGVLHIFCPYRRVAPAPAPARRPRLVVVPAAAPAPAPAPQPRPTMVQQCAFYVQRPAAAPAAPAPAPKHAPLRPAAVPATMPAPAAPAQPAPAPIQPAVAAPAPAEPQPTRMAAAAAAEPELEASAPAAAQRAHRSRRHRHSQRRRRSTSPQQAEQPEQPAAQQRASGVRVIPVESPRGASPAAASPTAAAASSGRAAASPEQAATQEQRERRRRAAQRIAAGVASNSDWEECDGSVTDCSLDDC